MVAAQLSQFKEILGFGKDFSISTKLRSNILGYSDDYIMQEKIILRIFIFKDFFLNSTYFESREVDA